jgi:hypothetical protein
VAALASARASGGQGRVRPIRVANGWRRSMNLGIPGFVRLQRPVREDECECCRHNVRQYPRQHQLPASEFHCSHKAGEIHQRETKDSGSKRSLHWAFSERIGARYHDGSYYHPAYYCVASPEYMSLM